MKSIGLRQLAERMIADGQVRTFLTVLMSKGYSPTAIKNAAESFIDDHRSTPSFAETWRVGRAAR